MMPEDVEIYYRHEIRQSNASDAEEMWEWCRRGTWNQASGPGA
jgi:hypothetical protein